MRNIVLVAGHSRKKYGCKAKDGTREFDFASSIISIVEGLVNNSKAVNVNLQTFEMSKLADKIEMTNKLNPYLAIELHFNSFKDRNVKGSEAFYWEEKDLSALLAHRYCDIFQKVSGVKTRRAKKDNEGQYKRLAWCRDIRNHSILVENEFLSYKHFNKELYFYYSISAMLRFLKSISW